MKLVVDTNVLFSFFKKESKVKVLSTYDLISLLSGI